MSDLPPEPHLIVHNTSELHTEPEYSVGNHIDPGLLSTWFEFPDSWYDQTRMVVTRGPDSKYYRAFLTLELVETTLEDEGLVTFTCKSCGHAILDRYSTVRPSESYELISHLETWHPNTSKADLYGHFEQEDA